MILIICIGVYILIGVLLNFFHPEVPEINQILRKINRPTVDDYIDEGSYTPRWKRVLVVVIIRFVTIVVGPVASLFDLIYNPIRKVMNIILRRYEEDNYDYLYFVLMNGAGEVSCQVCTYTSKLTGTINGDHGSDWNQKGYQCQSCGRFDEIEYPDRLDQLPRCDCGGEISRNEIVFCPECRSDHMIYNEQYASEEPNKPDIYMNLISPGNIVDGH